VYSEDHGVDVAVLHGAGAAGGLAGGLAAAGASLVEGFDLVADELDLDAALDGADLVVTGEGFLDEQSFDGKVVGGVLDRATEACVPVLAVAGEVFDDVGQRLHAVSLVERFGEERSRTDTVACVEEVVAEALAKLTKKRS
jgi:glycerate kinase